jgi:hypothetical protein
MRVDLGPVAHTGRGETERVDGPAQVIRPLRPPEREAFAQCRLVDLNHANPGRLQVENLIADRERKLLRGLRSRLIVTHKRPLQNRDRTRQHPLHRALGQ